MNSPTTKVACTPKEKTSGVAGILIAAPSPDGSGYMTGEYTDTDWKYWFQIVIETTEEG